MKPRGPRKPVPHKFRVPPDPEPDTKGAWKVIDFDAPPPSLDGLVGDPGCPVGADDVKAFVKRGQRAQAAVNALGADERTAAVLGALAALAEAIIDCEDRILAPHDIAQGGVEIPGKVWERIVDLARRVPR